MKSFMKIAGYFFAVATILAGIYFYIAQGDFLSEQDVNFGVTFSTKQARQLGLDPQETFKAILHDLGARKIRLPIYWEDIEPERGKFNFTEYDNLIHEAEKNNAELILIIGRKLPRWPECHIPSWVALDFSIYNFKFPKEYFQESVENYIRTVVERYKNSPAVMVWQIENEPFHKFGADCAEEKIKAENVDHEIGLVRRLDPERPVMLTDAGKAGTWVTSLKRADIVGVTMYYQVWNPIRGVVWSTFGPGLFWIKRKIIEPFFPTKKFIIAELQGEPYGPVANFRDYDIALQKELMNVSRFQETIRRARKAGFQENYLWGVEWWFGLKEKHRDPSLWNEAKKLFNPVYQL